MKKYTWLLVCILCVGLFNHVARADQTEDASQCNEGWLTHTWATVAVRCDSAAVTLMHQANQLTLDAIPGKPNSDIYCYYIVTTAEAFSREAIAYHNLKRSDSADVGRAEAQSTLAQAKGDGCLSIPPWNKGMGGFRELLNSNKFYTTPPDEIKFLQGEIQTNF